MTPNQLRKRRAGLGLTQQGLASALGVDRITVWRYETGRLTIPRWLPLALAGLQKRR